VFIGGSKALSPVMNDEQEMAFSPALTVAHRYKVFIRVHPWFQLAFPPLHDGLEQPLELIEVQAWVRECFLLRCS
jgi:hypothetical protein